MVDLPWWALPACALRDFADGAGGFFAGSSAGPLITSSSTRMAPRPFLVMRRERAPSSVRRQTGSVPRDWISSMRPSVRSLATTLPADLPPDLTAVQERGRRAARPPTAAPVGYGSGSRNPPSPEAAIAASTEAPHGDEAGGAGFRSGPKARTTTTVPLHSSGKASPFFTGPCARGQAPAGRLDQILRVPSPTAESRAS
jgi:hypothetical protein